MTNPMDLECGACLAGPGEHCFSVSSDEPRPQIHKLRIVAAAKALKRCPECSGLGWVPIDDE